MNIKKMLTLTLIMSTALFIMTSCGGDSEEKSPFPTDPIEIVAYGINDSMNVIKDEASNSMMNLGSYIGLEDSDLEKPEVTINFDISNAEGNAAVFYRSLNNTKSKDASLAFGFTSEGSTMQSSVNFTGNDMIMSFLSPDEPMVKYSMPKDTASSISDLAPLDRYVAALELAATEGAKDTWDADLSKMTDGLSANLTSENVEEATEVITHNGKELEATTYTLTAKETGAAEALTDLFNALNNDSDMNSLTSSSELAEEQTDTDTEDALASVKAVVNDEAKLASTVLTTTVYVNDETILACNMTFETPDGNFIINNQYAIDKNSKNITTKTIYVSGLEMTTTHVVTTDGDTENDKTTYSMNQAVPQSTFELINESAIKKTDDNYIKDFNVSYTSTEEGVVSSYSTIGKYEGITSGAVTNGTFSGTADTNESQLGAQTFNYTGTSLISDTDPQVEIPAFLADSGVEFTDVNELKTYLNDSSDSETANIVSPYEQKIIAITWMIRFNLNF